MLGVKDQQEHPHNCKNSSSSWPRRLDDAGGRREMLNETQRDGDHERRQELKTVWTHDDHRLQVCLRLKHSEKLAGGGRSATVSWALNSNISDPTQ